MSVTPVTRASAASRWVNCSEAAWLEQQYPDVTGMPAKEGTAAHEMAELVLNGTVSEPEELVDRQALNGVVMTGEMVPHVQMYIDHVRSRGVPWWIEESIEIQNVYQIITGRCDGAAFSFDQQTGILYIDDFKYGFRPVEVFENWQQLIYAIGMYIKVRQPDWIIRTVTMTIIQPRGYHHDGPIRSWTITSDELDVYFKKLIESIKAVMSPDRQCHSGSWCRDCKVLAMCATAKSAAMNAIDVVMDAIPDTDTPEQLSMLLDVLTHASNTIKHSLDAITARGEALILTGQPIPGYAYEPGKGKRRFICEQEAIASACAMGVDITTNKIVTPAEAERQGLSKAFVKSLTTVPSTAPHLVKRDVSTLADKVFKDVSN